MGDDYVLTGSYTDQLKITTANSWKKMTPVTADVKLTDDGIPGGQWGHDFMAPSTLPGPSAYQHYVPRSTTQSVTLRRLLYRDNDGDLQWNTTISHYDIFESLLGEDSHANRIFLAYLNKPAPANVKNIIMCTAGQQGPKEAPFPRPSSVTCQNADYALIEWSKIINETVSVRNDALAGQMYYDMTKAEKSEMEQAYTEWLLVHVDDPVTLKNIYLAGASRGRRYLSPVFSVIPGIYQFAVFRKYTSLKIFCSEFGPAFHLCLEENIGKMFLDGFNGNEERAGDITVGKSRFYKSEYFPFP